MPQRPEVPEGLIRRLGAILGALPRCEIEDAWVGVRWRVGSATVAHVFGGEDQIFRITLRAEPEEVMAFEHLGAPYFRAEWGGNVVGLMLGAGDEWISSDWVELTELLTDSYCLQAPDRLVALVDRPEAPTGRGRD